MTTASIPARPFSPWPYAIIGFFIVFVGGVVTFIAWAVQQDMDLVRKDYYDHEILFQQQIDRQKRAAGLGAQVALDFSAATQTVTVRIPTSHVGVALGTIYFYRPSDAKLDHVVRLALDAAGGQQIDAKNLRAGLWKIAVQWNADGQDYFVERAVVIGS